MPGMKYHSRMRRSPSSRSHALPALVLLAAAAVVAGGAPAGASCGSAACFLVTSSEQGTPAAGTFHVDLSWQWVDQTRKLRGSDSTDEVLVPKIDFETGEIELDHHREISTHTTMLQLALGYGVTSRLSVFGRLPLVVDKQHEHFDDVGTPEESFTNGDGTRGFGDVAVGVRYALLVGDDDLLLGSASIEAPTGPYKLRDSEGAINEPTIQPGSGSWDGTLALHYTHHPFPRPTEWFLAASQRLNGTNDLEYRIGDVTVVSAGLHGGTDRRWSWSVQLNARHAGRDEFFGMGVPSTGADEVVITPGLRLATSSGTELYGNLQVPVYQDVNEAQLARRAGLVLGISRTF